MHNEGLNRWVDPQCLHREIAEATNLTPEEMNLAAREIIRQSRNFDSPDPPSPSSLNSPGSPLSPASPTRSARGSRLSNSPQPFSDPSPSPQHRFSGADTFPPSSDLSGMQMESPSRHSRNGGTSARQRGGRQQHEMSERARFSDSSDSLDRPDMVNVTSL